MSESNLPKIVEVEIGNGLTVESWQEDDGEIIVGLRWACEQIGIDWSNQLSRLRNNPLFKDELLRRPSHHSGQRREIIGLPLDLFLMFLATINSAFVAERAREPLLVYQRECARALREYWTTGVAVNPYVQPMSNLDLMELGIKQLREHEKRITQVEQSVKSLYSATQMMTIAEFVYHFKYQAKMPQSMYAAFGRHLAKTCRDRGDIPRREITVPEKPWETEWAYPVGLLHELFGPWIKAAYGDDLLIQEARVVYVTNQV
jgi:hypothetical protein